jgi:hypothetical protein
MANDNSMYVRNGATCKDKWAVIYSDFKRIFNYMNGTGSNEEYWHMTP